MTRIDITSNSRLKAKLASGLVLSAFLALGTFVAPASARDDHRDGRGQQRDDHRGQQGWNNGYGAPPIVYGAPAYYPPPIVYGAGSGIGININIP